MRIIIFCITLSYCLALAQPTDDHHRPINKKKEKRQLDNYYANPQSYRLERRISNNNGPPFYSQFSRSYRKGRPPLHPTAPPYAVQMEPLIHYSQRDPLYDSTNTLPPDIDPNQDLQDAIDRGSSGDTIYIPHKPLIKYIEKPVFIKEPEPIIEIIIKESNVSLPPLPTEAPPPPQKKKKEEVQVFYVKYKKNPNGYGKDSVIYDKPVPAISPQIPEEPEPEEEWKESPPLETGYGDYDVTEPPKPSTTLRTIIKPDSEVYHSPGNNVKVTFGKEGFDYDKRSSKPEDYPGPQLAEQHPRARQLTSYSDVYFKRPNNNYQAESRSPQSYRPFNQSPSNQFNSRSPPNRDFNSRPPFFPPPAKYANQPPSFPNFSHSISHPPPPNYQRYQQFGEVLPPSQRKPVPYTPFEKLRPSQSFQLPHVAQNVQFRPETHYSQPHFNNRSPPSFAEVNNQFKVVDQQQQHQQNVQHHQNVQNQQQHHQNVQNHHHQQNHVQNIVPPGGQLIHSLPKYEQHLVVNQGQQQQQNQQQNQQQESLNRANKQVKQNYYRQQQNIADHRSEQTTTTRIYSTTTKATTTTQEPPTTTTKDPKILEAQLPDEVPEELRAQLLSSGILNHADISVLDYDKVGDIPLSDLPPEQLANFYSAGGAQQLSAAGSAQSPQFAALTSRRRDEESLSKEQQEAQESRVAEFVTKPKNVEMKVVKYNPDTEKGQKVQEAYLSESAKKVDPVVLNDNSYNRYLPLKLNGTQFPIPDVPELNGKLISSVVVLAPISYDFSTSARKTREAKPQNDLELLRNEPLKVLLENPTRENYRKFLENEKKTSVSQQAVILLVAGRDAPVSEKEIFMYDIASKTVSKLNGELSSAFVEAAEANSSDEAGNSSEASLDGQIKSSEERNNEAFIVKSQK